MRKQVEESVATGRRARPWGSKREVVMRLLRGEDLESVSRAVTRRGRRTGGLSFWLRGRRASCSGRRPSSAAAKIGELLMETELLYAKVDQLEAGGPHAMSGAQSGSPPVGRMACSGSAACGTAPAPAASPRLCRRRGPIAHDVLVAHIRSRSLAVSSRATEKPEAAGRGDAPRRSGCAG